MYERKDIDKHEKKIQKFKLTSFYRIITLNLAVSNYFAGLNKIKEGESV